MSETIVTWTYRVALFYESSDFGFDLFNQLHQLAIAFHHSTRHDKDLGPANYKQKTQRNVFGINAFHAFFSHLPNQRPFFQAGKLTFVISCTIFEFPLFSILLLRKYFKVTGWFCFMQGSLFPPQNKKKLIATSSQFYLPPSFEFIHHNSEEKNINSQN